MRNFFYLIVLACGLSFGQKNKLIFAYENPKSLLEFLDKNHVNYDTSDLVVLQQPAEWLELYYKEALTVPSLYLYNSEGKRIIGNKEADICGGVIKGIENADKIKAYDTDPKDTMQDWMGRIDFKFIPEDKIQEAFNSPFDLYVIIFYGKLIKTKSSNPTAFNWYNSLKKNTSLKIKPILLSIDIMDDWKLNQQFKDKFGLN